MSGKHQTLHCSNDGYVITCEGCQKLQVAFGTSLFSFTANEYAQFLKTVSRSLHKYDHLGAHSKSILLQVPGQEVTLILSKVELQQLHFMLEAADAELTAFLLLNLFAQN